MCAQAPYVGAMPPSPDVGAHCEVIGNILNKFLKCIFPRIALIVGVENTLWDISAGLYKPV